MRLARSASSRSTAAVGTVVGGLLAAAALALPAAASTGTAPGTTTTAPTATVTATKTTTKKCTVDPTAITGIGPTSLEFARVLPAGCPSPGRITVEVYAKKSDAQARKRVAGSATGEAGTALLVTGLKPQKKYWYVTSDFPDVRGPVTTLQALPTGVLTCTAGYRLVSTWGGGFVAEVTVTAGAAPIGGWNLSWIYTGGQAVVTAWGAKVDQLPLGVTTTWAGGTSTSGQPTDPTRTTGLPTVSLHTTGPTSTSRPPMTGPTSWLRGVQATDLPGTGSLAAGETFSFGILGAVPSGMSPSVPAVTCTATRP